MHISFILKLHRLFLFFFCHWSFTTLGWLFRQSYRIRETEGGQKEKRHHNTKAGADAAGESGLKPVPAQDKAGALYRWAILSILHIEIIPNPPLRKNVHFWWVGVLHLCDFITPGLLAHSGRETESEGETPEHQCHLWYCGTLMWRWSLNLDPVHSKAGVPLAELFLWHPPPPQLFNIPFTVLKQNS